MAVFVFFGSYIQYRLGMGGVVITELMFLAASILFVRLQENTPLRQVFPLHRPKGLALGSTAVLWAAAYLSMIIVNLILAYFYPAGVLGSGNSVNLVITSIPWGIAFLVVAVLPAVCEEALHRGVIQLRRSRILSANPWLIVLLMGLLFGAFHVSIWKFLPTAMLGAAMSYLLLRTGNMVYSLLLPFPAQWNPDAAPAAVRLYDGSCTGFVSGRTCLWVSAEDTSCFHRAVSLLWSDYPIPFFICPTGC